MAYDVSMCVGGLGVNGVCCVVLTSTFCVVCDYFAFQSVIFTCQLAE